MDFAAVPSISLYRSWMVCAQIAISIGAALSSLPSVAQTTAPDTLQVQIDDAFRQVLSAPGDTEVGLRYARLLVQAGNFEGGIASMERLLLAPNPPASLRLELAVLYYRLESYAVSETYLRGALADPALPDNLRQQAGQLLRDVVKRNQTNQLSGFLMLGLRGQTNPTARTDEDFIRSGGSLVARPDSQRRKGDTDTQLIGRIEHLYDLETQNSAQIASTLLGVVSHYSSVSSYSLSANPTKPRDLFLLEGTTGVRFRPDAAGTPGWSVRPHVILGNILLDGHQYAYSVGAGIDSNYRASERLIFDGAYELRNYSYSSRIDVREAEQQGGLEHTLRLRGSYELAPGQVLVGELIGRDHGADRGYFAYQSGEARLSYVVNYANPFGAGSQGWTTTLSSGILQRVYDRADPAVDPRQSREDTDWRSSVSTLIPLGDAFSLLLQAEYAKSSSNLPNYRYNNTSGLASLLWRF
jgi:hypothetical protein